MANRKCAKCRRHARIVVAYEHHKCPYSSCTCLACHPKRSTVRIKCSPGQPSHFSGDASLPANQVMLPAKANNSSFALTESVSPTPPVSMSVSAGEKINFGVQNPNFRMQNVYKLPNQKWRALTIFPPPDCKAIPNTAVNPGFVKSCPSSLIASHQPLTHSSVSVPGISSANAISAKCQKFDAPDIPQKVTSFAAKLGYSAFLRIPMFSKLANCSFITSSEAATSKTNCTQFSQAENVEDEGIECIEKEMADNVMVKMSDPDSMQQTPMTLPSAQLTFPVLSNNVYDVDIHDVKKEADENGLMNVHDVDIHDVKKAADENGLMDAGQPTNLQDFDNIGNSDLKITDAKCIPEEPFSCSSAYASCEENSSIMKEEVNIGHVKTVANDSNEVQHAEALQDIPICSSICEICHCTEISKERYALLKRQEFAKLMTNMYMFHRMFPDVKDKFYLPVLAACDGDFIMACCDLEYINVHKKCSDSLKLKLKTYGEEFERRKLAKVMHFLKREN